MADIGKVTPGSPIIPPVPQDHRVNDEEKDKDKHKHKDKRKPGEAKQPGSETPDDDEDGGKPGDGIDVYV